MRCSFLHVRAFDSTPPVSRPRLIYELFPRRAQAGKGEGAGGGGAGLWEELRQGREAWLERGPCMGRARLSAVMSDERLTAALLWRTETAELEKVGFVHTT